MHRNAPHERQHPVVEVSDGGIHMNEKLFAALLAHKRVLPPIEQVKLEQPPKK